MRVLGWVFAGFGAAWAQWLTCVVTGTTRPDAGGLMDDEPWLLQVLREETDRAVIGEFVQRHTGQPADVRLVRHRADQLSREK